MPEAVFVWTKEKDLGLVQRVQSHILSAYRADISKHQTASMYGKTSLVWDSIPSQLSRGNKRFIYSLVQEGARAREYENSIQWLCDAQLLYKIHRISKPGLPITAYDELSAFKLYMGDTGLLLRQAKFSPLFFEETRGLYMEFKGSLIENFVLQSLLSHFEVRPRYWAVDNPRYEVDFILQKDNDIFPVEVKASTNIESRSLKAYKNKFKERVGLRVRFSEKNLILNDDVLNIPLFMVDEFGRLLTLYKKEYQ